MGITLWSTIVEDRRQVRLCRAAVERIGPFRQVGVFRRLHYEDPDEGSVLVRFNASDVIQVVFQSGPRLRLLI